MVLHQKTYSSSSSLSLLKLFQNNVPTFQFNQSVIDSHNLEPIFHFDSDYGAGELGIVRTIEDKHIRDIGYKQHAFNALVSNNIGLTRNIPDTRNIVCLEQKYSIDLPSASIVMCFFNEHLTTLLRSINSVLLRSRKNLLKEIILVDDLSDLPDLKKDLEDKIRDIDIDKKVKIIRNENREGLIRSRVIGSRAAIGDVLIFLDSHIEVNNHWLEPLLDAVQRENSTLAVPVIDIINPDTFAYSPSPLVRGGFNWGLHFKWENLPVGTLVNNASFAGPFISPTMAGGLFAVNRQYFKFIGEYDMGMDIWGGENLEISFRVWQCGGAIKIYPCSRVGHIFRKRRPYGSTDGSNTMMHNSLRLAYVWMDEYKEYYIDGQKKWGQKVFEFGNIDDRLELRKRLNCSSFKWYIENIYPELDIPGQKRKIIDSSNQKVAYHPWHTRKRNYIKLDFMIRLSDTDLCITVKNQKKENGFWKRGSTLYLKPCTKAKNQMWYQTEKSELILDKLYCLEASADSGKSAPVIGKCHEMLGDQQWRYTSESGNSPIYNSATGTCIKANAATVGSQIILDLCSKTNLNSWDFYS
ncbi:polypeptide N-acetylgalactosaminyltransferase 35A-like isoform X2 [Condylostylus longicornis]|uniref:polypeptide N-acetylgalactosaminyltransferase 35A-like isoform X2 n=1 Tax=Condylostylus longicornis TaxID=2530218 RepID=UPI00244DBEB4|nr:polypeptide N-acetylgalactosaminyltransferase 35A-like isoform X2 [Condylostylus longicornis]